MALGQVMWIVSIGRFSDGFCFESERFSDIIFFAVQFVLNSCKIS